MEESPQSGHVMCQLYSEAVSWMLEILIKCCSNGGKAMMDMCVAAFEKKKVCMIMLKHWCYLDADVTHLSLLKNIQGYLNGFPRILSANSWINRGVRECCKLTESRGGCERYKQYERKNNCIASPRPLQTQSTLKIHSTLFV